MSLPKATSRLDLIKRLRKLGWDGPRPGTKHPFMAKGKRKLRVPNPHEGDIDRRFLKFLLEQGGISEEEWNGNPVPPED